MKKLCNYINSILVNFSAGNFYLQVKVPRQNKKFLQKSVIQTHVVHCVNSTRKKGLTRVCYDTWVVNCGAGFGGIEGLGEGRASRG